MTKRILALLFCLVMMFSMLPASAFAEEAAEGTNQAEEIEAETAAEVPYSGETDEAAETEESAELAGFEKPEKESADTEEDLLPEEEPEAAAAENNGTFEEEPRALDQYAVPGTVTQLGSGKVRISGTFYNIPDGYYSGIYVYAGNGCLISGQTVSYSCVGSNFSDNFDFALVPGANYRFNAVVNDNGGSNVFESDPQYFSVDSSGTVPEIKTGVSQSFPYPDDLVYKYTAPVAGTYTITMSGEGYYALYKSDGSLINSRGSSFNSSSLTFTASLGEAVYLGGYSYNSSNPLNVKITAPSTLSVPVITKQPVSTSAVAGTKATFKVTASGSDLSYQWQYKKTSSGSWVDSKGTGYSKATFTPGVSLSMNGYQYRCKVWNSSGEVYSDAATLTVTSSESSAPVITKQPVPTSAAAGTKATFKITASGSGLSYQWQYRKTSSGSWVDSKGTGYSKATFTPGVSLSMNGYQYRCKVWNSSGEVYSDAVTLTVTSAESSAPVITKQPVPTSAAAGTKATFKITASGSGLSYQWQYKKTSSGTWTDSKGTGYSKATFTPGVSLSMNGYLYRCKVWNSLGEVYSDAVTLTVTSSDSSEPVITKQPESVTVQAGTRATFTVTASGSDLSYQWQYRKTSSGTWTDSKGTGYSKATFTPGVSLSMNGYEYRCKVWNSAGTVYSNAVTLTVEQVTYRAILIGEENYSDVLPGPINDVNGMRTMLSGLDGMNWKFYVKTDATRSEIESLISAVAGEASSNDITLFYYSGHGLSSTGDYLGALCTVDDKFIKTSELASMLNNIPGKIDVLLDSCFSGAAIYTKNGDLIETEPDLSRINSSIISAFSGYSASLADIGNGTIYEKTGELANSKFYVLTAASFDQESQSWGYSNDDGSTWFYYGVFTRGVTRSAGYDYKDGTWYGSMLGDSNSDSVLTLNECYVYSTNFYSSYGADFNVQVYPANSSWRFLFDNN